MKKEAEVKIFKNIPEELKQSSSWVGWRPKKDPKGGKFKKLPVNPHTNRAADVTNPNTWGTFDQAQKHFQTHTTGQGLGFIFTNGHVGVDLDDCFQKSGKVKPKVERILELVNSYTEISQSGQGLHIIAKGQKPGNFPCKINTGGGGISGSPSPEDFEIEVYDQGRFFVMTGKLFRARTELRTVDFTPFFQEFFSPLPAMAAGNNAPALSLSDQAVIEKASSAHDGDEFKRLFAGDSTLSGDHSKLDWAFCRKLAFWTGKDAGQMDRIFRSSGLMREKWDKKHASTGETYGEITIRKAIEQTAKVYSPQQAPQLPPHPAMLQHTPEPESIPAEDPENETSDFWAVDHPTDLGNSQRLVKAYGPKIRYCWEFQSWYVWNGKQWKLDLEDKKLVKFGKETAKKIYAEAADQEQKEDRQTLVKWAQKSEEKKRIADMIWLARTEPDIEIEAEQLDADPYLLNVKNGIIDLRTGELMKHDPEKLLTKYVPIEYDPKATCPTWESAILKYMGEKDGDTEAIERAVRLHDFLQRAVGYSLTGDICEQCLFFLYGEGKNGKSTFTNIISLLLGDYFQHVRIESLLAKKNETIPHDIASLPGARLVVTSEVPENRKMNETLVKDMTGGDAITARYLYKNNFTFHPIFKLWIFGNDKPIVTPSEAMFRRINLIEFNIQIPEEERDPHFEKKLQKELPGILRWAVEGCQEWLKIGLKRPQEVIDATNAYRDEMDFLSDFIEECCTLNVIAQVPVKKLYEEFVTWCQASGRKPAGKRQFNSRLERKFPQLEKQRGNKNLLTWYGIGLLSEEQQNLDL